MTGVHRPLAVSSGLAWLVAVMSAVLVALPGTAHAATFPTIAPDVIAVQGKIELGDCDRWTAALGLDIRTVLLNSPGGRDGQGQCISRSIAARRLRTVVLQKCTSICFLLFAAGAERVACEGARIGVHRPRIAYTAEESSDPHFLDVILDYAKRYHVPDAIQRKLATTPGDTITFLTPEDLASMEVKACR